MLVDMHCHTGWGSGDSHTDPNLLIRQAMLYGLDALCVTEHNQVWNLSKLERLAEKYEFRIFPGVEIDTDFGHVLVYGQAPRLHERREGDDARHPLPRRDFQRERPADDDLEQGEARIVLERELREEAVTLFDGIEMYNGLASPRERLLSGALAEALERPMSGGSDTHRHPEVGATFTVFEDDIQNVRQLITAIQSGRMRGGDWHSEKIPDRRRDLMMSRHS